MVSDPVVWLLVSVSIVGEIGAVDLVLLKMGVDVTGFRSTLVLIQLLTWAAFLALWDWLLVHYRPENCMPFVATVLMVAVVEVPMLRAASRGWLLAPPAATPLTLRQAATASALGNAASWAALLGIGACILGLMQLVGIRNA
jgi:hypothetical protein